jgi:hypothetical protein
MFIISRLGARKVKEEILLFQKITVRTQISDMHLKGIKCRLKRPDSQEGHELGFVTIVTQQT